MTAITYVFVEHVLWQPGEDWRAAVAALGERFRRVRPLDVDTILGAGALHEQLDAIASWAEGSDIDVDRELGRYLDEHLSMHVRPNAANTRAVRALAAAGPVHGVSALPPRAAESIARHTGVWRSFAELHADVRGAEVLAAIVRPAECVVAIAPTPVPDGANVATDLAPPAAAP